MDFRGWISKTKNPDIVITDMKMNRMSGIEFLGTIRPAVSCKRPVIVISGYKDFNYVKKAIENRV